MELELGLGNPNEVNAFMIESGRELEHFLPNHVEIKGKDYVVLTGWEGTGRCFWCGYRFEGKPHHYCYDHMQLYYRHFMWSWARNWCIKRQGGICANCETKHGYSLEVHHIVPLKGSIRLLTAFNLPWNLIGFCHDCHQEVHAVMREPKVSQALDLFALAELHGQFIFEEIAALAHN